MECITRRILIVALDNLVAALLTRFRPLTLRLPLVSGNKNTAKLGIVDLPAKFQTEIFALSRRERFIGMFRAQSQKNPYPRGGLSDCCSDAT